MIYVVKLEEAIARVSELEAELKEFQIELQEQTGKRLETYKRASALEALLAKAEAERSAAYAQAARALEDGSVHFARASELETLLAECETIVEHILSGYLDDSRARALLAKLKDTKKVR